MTFDLVERSGPLKAELLTFSRHLRYDDARRAVLSAHGVEGCVTTPEAEARLINALDALLLQHRLRNGQTIVEQFVAARPGLPAPEREMLLGWRDVVEGIFEVGHRDGDALVVTNLLDELAYRVRSNMGPDTFRSVRPRSFILARLVPVGDDWLVSGVLRPVGRRGREALYKVAADFAMDHPELVFRNPDLLERAWELQRADRERFVRFFGADLVRVPGAELRGRMRDYYAFSRGEVLAGLAARQETGTSANRTLPDLDYPPRLVQSGTVAVIYDATEGQSFLAGFGEFEQAFTDPGVLGQHRYRQRVVDYLDDDSVSPLPFRRMAERDADRTGEVLGRVLGRRSFDWRRDGETLMRERKAAFFERPALPRILPVSRRLAPYVGRTS